MNIKAIAFSAQQRVAEQRGISLQRSHVYEALAAAFGFASYASLCADHVFDVGAPEGFDSARLTDCIARRLDQLGVSEAPRLQVASELATIVSDQHLRVVSIDSVIESLLPGGFQQDIDVEIDDDFEEEYDDGPAARVGRQPFEDWDVSDFLRSGLEEAAKRGSPKAHYVLSLILKSDGESHAGSSYWHDRQLQGEQLSGVELEWANAHQVANDQEDERLRHLREAARLGHPDACVDAAEEFQDPDFLRLAGGAQVRDPAHAAEVAAALGQVEQARNWCFMAAEGGDIDAIRWMIETFDRENLARCWTWVHFARLLGTDLTQSHYQLVNEDGSDYDDDVGGPGYPVGTDGVDLPRLDESQDANAHRDAANMAARLRERLKE